MHASTERRFIFIANPKTGTSAFARALNPISDIRSHAIDGVGDHWPASRLKPWFAERGLAWEEFYSFMAVRDPWRRAVSNYLYGLRREQSIWHKPAVEAATLSDFLKSEIASVPKRIRTLDYMARDEDGAMLIDHVFRIEDIAEESPRISARIGAPLELEQVNVTPAYEYRDYFCEEAVELVRERYRSDIEFGGYEY
jgi:hypothetical protein